VQLPKGNHFFFGCGISGQAGYDVGESQASKKGGTGRKKKRGKWGGGGGRRTTKGSYEYHGTNTLQT